MKFLTDIQKKYHPAKWVNNIAYQWGYIECMIQTEALRLAMLKTPLDKLKPADVLNNGFYQIKNLDTGSMASTPISYSAGKIEGVDKVRVDQLQKGKILKMGVYPIRISLRNLYRRCTWIKLNGRPIVPRFGDAL